MADNVAITQGSGTSIATEDVSGVQHQKIKIEFGGDGVATMVSASDPLPVSATIDTTGLATDATDTNTATIAGAVSGTEMQVDVISMPAVSIDTTGLATDATDTSVASIDSKTPTLGQALAAASVPVILPAATITTLTPPAAITGFGTAANQTTIIGHLDGVETSLSSIDGKITAVNTGAVVVSSSALPTGASTASKQPALGTAGTPSADVITVQGTTSMTPLKVDGSAVTQPVSGTFWQATQPVSLASAPTTTVTATDLDIRPLVNTDVVTAELSAVDNAVLDTIAAKDFATQTTLAAMNAKMVTGTDIGDVTINNSTGAAAVNIQDGGNTITVDGTVAVSGTVAVTQSGTWDEVGINDSGNSITVDYATTGSGTATGALRVELPTNGTGVIATVGAVTAITNALPAGTNAIGKLAANSGVDIGDVDVTSIVLPRNLIGPGQPGTAIDSYTQAAISAVTGTDQSLIAAPGANKQIWVYGIGFTCSVAGTVAIQDEDNTAITGVVSYAQYSGPLVHPSGNFSMPLWKVATNKALEADVTTATINGWIDYAIISV